MVNYCKNLDGLLSMFSIVIKKELENKQLNKEEYSSAFIGLIEQNGEAFRQSYCSLHCEERLNCNLSSLEKRISL